MSEQLFNLTSPCGPDETDPRDIEWSARQSRALVPFAVDEDSLPVNPVEPNLPEGRNGLWHWGEAVAADATVVALTETFDRVVLMVERGDGNGYALPGGMVDPGETASEAAARELAEETGLQLAPDCFRMWGARYVPDPRAGRNAWMVTVPGIAPLATGPVAVEGRDDARQAVWLPAASYAELEKAIAERGGFVFTAHRDLLRAQLG